MYKSLFKTDLTAIITEFPLELPIFIYVIGHRLFFTITKEHFILAVSYNFPPTKPITQLLEAKKSTLGRRQLTKLTEESHLSVKHCNSAPSTGCSNAPAEKEKKHAPRLNAGQ